MGFLEAGREMVDSVDGAQVVVTGTGIPSIDPKRAGSGVLIRHGDISLHFDAGRNTATRVVEAGVDVADLDAIFLTHYHSDHVIGLDDFLLSRWLEDDLDEAEPLVIVAPNGSTVRFCERLIELWDHDLEVRADHNGRSPDPRVDIVGFDTPSEPVEVWSKGDVRVLANGVRHEPVVGAVGYRIETPDGVVVISGDTAVCDEVAALAAGADVVIYEALRTGEILAMPEELHFIVDYHADTRAIGAQMEQLNVPKLLLTHLIPAPNSPEEEEGFIDDVRSGGFRGEVHVCRDLDAIQLGSAVVRNLASDKEA